MENYKITNNITNVFFLLRMMNAAAAGGFVRCITRCRHREHGAGRTGNGEDRKVEDRKVNPP